MNVVNRECWCGHGLLMHMGDEAECVACCREDNDNPDCYGFRVPPAPPRKNPLTDPEYQERITEAVREMLEDE